MYEAKIRVILVKHSRLNIDLSTIGQHEDLYKAGLTSLTTVNIMLAIEDEFDIEFPDNKLNRQTFDSIDSLVDVVETLVN